MLPWMPLGAGTFASDHHGFQHSQDAAECSQRDKLAGIAGHQNGLRIPCTCWDQFGKSQSP